MYQMDRICITSFIFVLTVLSAIPALVAYRIAHEESDPGPSYDDSQEETEDDMELKELLKVKDVLEMIRNAKDPSHRNVARSKSQPKSPTSEESKTKTVQDRSDEEDLMHGNRRNQNAERRVLVEDNIVDDSRVRSMGSELLSSADLAQLWLNFGVGKITRIECHLPGLEVKTRCSGNIQEVMVQLEDGEEEEESVEGRVTLDLADNALLLRHGKQKFYGVPQVVGTHDNPCIWHLTENLTRSDITDYSNCDHMNYVIIIQVNSGFSHFRGSWSGTGRSQACRVSVICKQPDDVVKIRMHDTALQKAFGLTRVSHIAKVAMAIRKGNKDVAAGAELPEGTEVKLRLSVLSPQVNIHVYVLYCEARLEESKVLLIKDGCNKTSLLSRFYENLESQGDEQGGTPRLMVLQAKLRLFNTKTVSKSLTILCKVKVCGGLCPEKSPCVQSEGTMKHRELAKDVLLSEVIELKKNIVVSGIPIIGQMQKPGSKSQYTRKSTVAWKLESEFGHDLNTKSMEDGEEEAELVNYYDDPSPHDMRPRFVLRSQTDNSQNVKCISEKYFYSVIGIICGLFMILLIICVYFTRLFVVQKVQQICWEEVESPSKTFYGNYSSPRPSSNI